MSSTGISDNTMTRSMIIIVYVRASISFGCPCPSFIFSLEEERIRMVDGQTMSFLENE